MLSTMAAGRDGKRFQAVVHLLVRESERTQRTSNTSPKAPLMMLNPYSPGIKSITSEATPNVISTPSLWSALAACSSLARAICAKTVFQEQSLACSCDSPSLSWASSIIFRSLKHQHCAIHDSLPWQSKRTPGLPRRWACSVLLVRRTALAPAVLPGSLRRFV